MLERGERAIAPRRIASAVLVPIFRDERGELRVLLVQRGMRGVHAGQLGFPGGKREPTDRSLLETALRETEEEVGLVRDRIEVLTSLDPLDTRATGYRVHPYLARIVPPPRWRLAEGEIAGILTPTLQALTDPRARQDRELSFADWPKGIRVACVLLDDGRLLWGLTLRLLDSLVPRLLAGEWDI